MAAAGRPPPAVRRRRARSPTGLRTRASGRRLARPSISSSMRTDRARFPSRARTDGFFEAHDRRPGGRSIATGSGSTAIALRPDPVSRFQPDGPHGPSAVVDPGDASRGPIGGVERRRPGRPGRLRDARRHVHARRHVGGGGGAAAGARGPRRHRRRDDAGRRLRRARSAGATTASTSTRRRASTARPTICAASSIARTPTASA